MCGAFCRNRTGDLILTMDALCLLSYEGGYAIWGCDTDIAMERVMGIEPTQSAWEADILPLNYTRKYAETNKRITL